MKKKKPSIRRYITWYLLALTGLVTLVYSLLMNFYLIKGIKSEAGFDMELKATYFAQDYKENPHSPLPKDILVSSCIGLQNLPDNYKRTFAGEKYEHRELLLSREKPENGNQEDENYLLLLPYDLHDGKRLFITKTYKPEHDAVSNHYGINLLFFLAFPLGIFVVALFFMAVRFMLQKLYLPMGKLLDWAGNLDAGGLAKPAPDFGFEEVNHLASLLHGNMKKLSQTLEREQRFLRNASHELRTPIAIIKSNIELLDKIEGAVTGPVQLPWDRIRRAAHNMNQLVETLLWLGMDEKKPLKPVNVALDSLTNELIRENSYLLEGKDVKVELDLNPSQVRVAPYAARIAIGNLIRNAFQYTALGKVKVAVQGNSVVVINLNQTPEDFDHTGSDYGFGLGLVLVDQITEKSGWQYENRGVRGGREARLSFSAAICEPVSP